MTLPTAPKGPTAPKTTGKPNLPPTTSNDESFSEDFVGVTAGEAFQVVPEGYYVAKVTEFVKEPSKSGNPQFVWSLKIMSGTYRGVVVKFWTSLLPQARWKVIQSLQAVGVDASDKVANFKRSDVVGKLCVMHILEDEYNGRASHKVDSLIPADEDACREAEFADLPFSK